MYLKNANENLFELYILLHKEQEILLVEDCILWDQSPTVHHPQLPKYRPQRKSARKTLNKKKNYLTSNMLHCTYQVGVTAFLLLNISLWASLTRCSDEQKAAKKSLVKFGTRYVSVYVACAPAVKIVK